MKEFALIFRMDITEKPSAKKMNLYMDQWQEWVGSIPVVGGNHFSTEGRLLKPKNILKKEPYFVGKTAVAGYLVIQAESLTKAVAIAKKCPILQGNGTSVEVREAVAV